MAHISDIYNLGTKGALCYVFVFLLGFYVMLRAFNFRPYLAALGAIIWAFSSYFFIIIAAGHIWKVMTLAYIPPTIGGLILCYRGRLLWGGAVTALFTAMQVLSNHVQMTYYFLFVMGLIVVAYGIQALRRKDDGLGNGVLSPKRWLKATGVIVVAGILGVAANLPNLYHTYDYAKHTMRGGSELTPLPAAKQSGDGAEASKGGLNYDYITQWSYGVDETMTLLIPNFKGGGTKSAITEENVFDEPYSTVYQHIAPIGQYFSQNPAVASRVSAMPGQNQYWGDQPFTVGPVYVGAFVCFLFVFALFVVRGPLKWAMAAATLVSLFFAWGHNVPGVTHFLIDHLPMYNKFRTVSSALVIAEFTMPLLGIMALAYALRHRDVLSTLRGKIGLGVATTVTTGLCLLFWLAPTAFGPLLSADEVATMDLLAKTGAFDANFLGSYTDAINVMRGAVLSPRPSARSSCSSFAAASSCSARASSRFQPGPPAERWPWWPWWTCGRSTATTSTTTTSPTPSCAAKIWRRKRRPTSRFYLTPTPTTACSTTPWATPSAKTPRAIGTRTSEATMPPNCNATKTSLSAISIRSMQRFIKL